MNFVFSRVSRSIQCLISLPYPVASSIFRMQSRNFTVIIEGNIASGKTEVVDHVADVKEISIISEPIGRWQNVENSGANLLEKFYSDPQRWCLPFQSYVQLTMFEEHQKAQSRPLAVMERSIYSARHCFVENLFRTKVMSAVEYEILDAWYRQLCLSIHVDLIVYLRCDPEICKKRIETRGRKEEQGITLKYLQQLHDLHEEWLIGEKANLPTGCKLVVLDSGVPMEEMLTLFDQEKENFLSTAKRKRKRI